MPISKAPRTVASRLAQPALSELGQLSQDEVRLLPSNIVFASSDRHLALTVRFVDATLGRVVFEERALIGSFAMLKDPRYFERFEVASGLVAWPQGPALDSDSLYRDIRAHGVSVLR